MIQKINFHKRHVFSKPKRNSQENSTSRKKKTLGKFSALSARFPHSILSYCKMSLPLKASILIPRICNFQMYILFFLIYQINSECLIFFYSHTNSTSITILKFLIKTGILKYSNDFLFIF